MFYRLLFLFTVIPVLELALLIEVGRRIGSLPTIALVLITGFVGALLAKQQGLSVLRSLQTQASAGHMPGDALLDGFFVLVGAVTLITPGIVTDLFGILFLLPQTRSVFKGWLKHKLRFWIESGSVHIFKWR